MGYKERERSAQGDSLPAKGEEGKAQDMIRNLFCYYVEHPEAWDAFRADVAAEMERQTEVS